MLVNLLALVIVLGIELAVRPGDGLGSLIRLETQIADLVFVRLLLIAQAVVTEHQVIVRLQVFRIDRQHRLQDLYRVGIFALQKQDAAKIIQRHAISRILSEDLAQVFGRAIVIAVAAQNLGVEEMSAGKVRAQRQRLLEHGAGAVHVAFLHRCAANVHPAVRILEGQSRSFCRKLPERPSDRLAGEDRFHSRSSAASHRPAGFVSAAARAHCAARLAA